MPPEYYDKLRLLFRWEVGSRRNGKSTVNPDVHEMYDLSMGCYHLGNALQAFLPVVQDSNDHTLNGRQTEYKFTAAV